MIIYSEKGIGLSDAVRAAGHWLVEKDGVWISSNDVVVQQIIDDYDPLVIAKSDAIELINHAAGEARIRYTTNSPGQDATYQLKLQDANAFKMAGYPETLITDYPFINAEANANGTSGEAAADFIIATANQWKLLAATIEQIRRAGSNAVMAQTDWSQCKVAAQPFIDQLELI